jgi:aminopeptidase N
MDPPFHIPFAVKIGGHERVLSVTKREESFVFDGLDQAPVPSLLRGFSAPVIVRYPYSETDLLALLAKDDDPFNRWEAGQRLATEIILKAQGKPSPAFIGALRQLLKDRDPAFIAEALTLPSEAYLAEQMEVVDPDALHAARDALRRSISSALKAELLSAYQSNRVSEPYAPDPGSSGKRALRNVALSLLMELETQDVIALALEQYETADNMTDAFAALACLANSAAAQREPALESFYERWRNEALVVDKWFAVQSTSRRPDTLERVRSLMAHPAFDIKVPNKVYALIYAFSGNQVRFHAADGGGYAFLADQVLALDRLNPQVAARMARGFDRWKKFDAGRQAHARAQLERIRDAEGLSRDVAEIVTRALA